MSCDSAHKTLPVLTGGAYLHLSEEWAERVGRQAKKAMELFGSTSPSYLILQSLDLCNRYLAEGYREKLQWTIGQIGHLRGQLKKQGWTVMMDSDPLKLTIFTGEKGYRGREVAEVLRAHEVECEFADLDAVVLMATPENTERDFQRIEKALERLPQKEKIEPSQMPQILPKQKMRIREAIFGRWEEISCEEAVGRICASPCVSCPPAIPIGGKRRGNHSRAAAAFSGVWHRKNRGCEGMKRECRERHSFFVPKSFTISLKFYNFFKFSEKGTKTHCIVI